MEDRINNLGVEKRFSMRELGSQEGARRAKWQQSIMVLKKSPVHQDIVNEEGQQRVFFEDGRGAFEDIEAS